MKFLVGLIAAFLIIIAGGTGYILVTANNDIYSNEETQISYDEVGTHEGDNLYYYYSPVCNHCQSIKKDVINFSEVIADKEGVNLYLVNLQEPTNSSGVSSAGGTQKDPALINSHKDIKIEGTPTMVRYKDKKFIDYKVGASPIVDLLKEVAAEHAN